jgi:hypothetical protein
MIRRSRAKAGDQRWVGAQVASRPGLLADPAVSVFQATKSNVTGRAVDIARTVGDRKITGREAATQFLSDVTALAVLAVDSDDLAEALKEVGLAEVEVNESPQPLHGFAGRPGVTRAELIIRRRSAAGARADIGFARSPDVSFTAVMDSMDIGMAPNGCAG